MPPTPTCLAHFTEEERSAKVHALLEDWSSPTLSPVGLCRAHDLSLSQIRAISALPLFTDALEDMRHIQSMRQEHIEHKAHRLVFDRLCYLVNQVPTSAAFSKEIRLAAKLILEIIGTTQPPKRARSVSDGVLQEPEASAQNVPSHNPPPSPTGEVARRSRDGGGCTAIPPDPLDRSISPLRPDAPITPATAPATAPARSPPP